MEKEGKEGKKECFASNEFRYPIFEASIVVACKQEDRLELFPFNLKRAIRGRRAREGGGGGGR